MNITSKSIIGLIIAGATLGVYLLLFKTSHWYRYAQHKKDKPPRDLVVKAARYVTADSPTAIDFGSNIGNESLYLLQQGYRVTAVEPDVAVVNLLTSREEFKPYTNTLTILNNSFEDVAWDALAPVDLFVASYSLPYVRPEAFKGVWQQMVNHINPDGYFVGQLFIPEYSGFKERERKAMTFLTKEEILALFNNFTINHINYIDEESINYDGNKVRARYYEIIAQKPL